MTGPAAPTLLPPGPTLPFDTARLTVRRFGPDDLRDYLAYWSPPEVVRFTGPMTEARAVAFLAAGGDRRAGDAGGYVALAVEDRADRRVVGEVGLFVEPAAASKGDIGWIIGPDRQGRGYATEAAAVMLAHGFLTLGLRRITSGCDGRNAASLGVMRRLGLRREGHLVRSRPAEAAWHDEHLFALLRDEWLARAGDGGRPVDGTAATPYNGRP